MPKLNYGCGETLLEDYINIDTQTNAIVKPDKVCDIKLGKLPYEDEYFEEVMALHVIEHIEKFHWQKIFTEFYRVLKTDGDLILAYPEFERCAHNFITNFRGQREFWEQTLYGRQSHPGDYHVCAMRTDEVVAQLQCYGFYDVRYGEEVQEEWSTFLICKKGAPGLTTEALYKKEIFGL